MQILHKTSQNPTHIGSVSKFSAVLQHGRGLYTNRASYIFWGFKWDPWIEVEFIWICECPDYQFAGCPKQFGAHSQKCKYNMPPPTPAWVRRGSMIHYILIRGCHVFTRVVHFGCFLVEATSALTAGDLFHLRTRSCGCPASTSTSIKRHAISPKPCNLQCHCALLDLPWITERNSALLKLFCSFFPTLGMSRRPSEQCVVSFGIKLLVFLWSPSDLKFSN